MKNNQKIMLRSFYAFVALVAVYYILKKQELYIPRSFSDTQWNETRNDKRVANYFNHTSPEEFQPKMDNNLCLLTT